MASNPRRLGRSLRFELEGCWSARRGRYRIIYRIDKATRSIKVLAV
ncbi:MAG TPA: type II toxin-antitoxin system RelE/ParE family toxin, partial [Solirubrobacteraceae bacterium]|nr:type II toxin-antitoxin system RelE/ParE family toxin [Solirubrobacteraceae bacterium]